MSARFIRIGNTILNIDEIVRVCWFDDPVVVLVWFVGNTKPERFRENEAVAFWDAMKRSALDIGPVSSDLGPIVYRY